MLGRFGIELLLAPAIEVHRTLDRAHLALGLVLVPRLRERPRRAGAGEHHRGQRSAEDRTRAEAGSGRNGRNRAKHSDAGSRVAGPGLTLSRTSRAAEISRPPRPLIAPATVADGDYDFNQDRLRDRSPDCRSFRPPLAPIFVATVLRWLSNATK